MAIAETGEKLVLCSNCEKSNSIEDLYKCTQCNEMDSTEINIDTGSIHYLCDLCTVAHLKKSYSVRDHRSLQPSICTEHKMVCLEYCIDCDELFCGKCVAKHRSHASKSMVERASEVRSKVFDLLTEWESNEKAALRKRESVSGIVNQHESEVETLLKQVEDIDKLKEEVTAEIRVKFAEFKKSETRFEDHVQKVGQTQKELRGLLSMSDGSMIEAFQTVETNFGSLGVAQCEIGMYEMNTNAFGTTIGFVEFNKRIFNQVVEKLKLRQVEKQHVPASLG
ncbi:RING finger domain and kelch repeat-containing protein DDB_G0271372-like [Symsagittifera roscoffensis]|uniref:RING finger domain and kelch repeat-containing protein DDB_G0271372-like n=1 Tax=Symsagittifera roscoffensis TaxID=84072 RepID=UPI00307C5E45